MSLSSCSWLAKPNDYQFIPWKIRKKQLEHLKTWGFNGSFSIRSPEHNVIGNIDWQQNHNRYQVHLSGPLGIDSIEVIGNAKQVRLIKAGQPTVYAKTPEALLQSQVGWQLPIQNLNYWLKGLPIPHLTSKMTFDRYQHSQVIQQQHWHVEYQDYQRFNGVELPGRIDISHQDLAIRIVIKQWNLNTKKQ